MNFRTVRNLILIVLVAFFAFGGTFTCTAHNGDDTIHTTNNSTSK